MNTKTRKIGLISMVVGIVFCGFVFIPFLSVSHPDTAGFRIDVFGLQMPITRTYSPIQFVLMLFSPNYNLRGYTLPGIFFIAVTAFALFAIICGIFLLCKSRRRN